MDEVHRVEQWRANWDADHAGDIVLKELETWPEPTHWLVLHAACDPVSEPCPYATRVESSRVPAIGLGPLGVDWPNHEQELVVGNGLAGGDAADRRRVRAQDGRLKNPSQSTLAGG